MPSPPTSPSRYPLPQSMDLPRPVTPDNKNGGFIIHDPDSPCMIALPSTPSRGTIVAKPSLGELHPSPTRQDRGPIPFHPSDYEHQEQHQHQHQQEGRLHNPHEKIDGDTDSVFHPPTHAFYDGTKSATSSSTAFESGLIPHSSESYLIIDPRNDPRLFKHGAASPTLKDASNGAPKRKKVDFNKPLKFWLIFVSLCFSCLLSALDLVSFVFPDHPLVNPNNADPALYFERLVIATAPLTR